MKKLLISGLVIIILASAISCVILLLPNKPMLGVWWWDDKFDNSYLNFANENNVTEVYYCSDNFDDETSKFISSANQLGMKVYFLAGEYEWLENRSGLINKINSYESYQQKYSNSQFAGIHLDIEPHQHELFNEKRGQLIYNLVELSYDLKNEYPQIKFDYDIPFWLHDEINFNNKNLPAYAHIITNADRVFIMSYRDTADQIYDISKEEIEFAKTQNKILVLGVETKSSEGDKVSFMEEGKQIMYSEIQKLREKLPNDFGVCIHHIKSWYDLKE